MEGNFKFYVVRNKQGKYFRAKGYGGGGKSWVDNLNECKIYPKEGSAKSIVTYYATNYPEYGIPDIVIFTANETEVIDQTERVKKVQIQKVKREINYQKWRAEQKIRDAEKELDNAKKRLEELVNKK